jgi:hypothetical protein
MLFDAAVFSPCWATRLIETAKPALSSDGELTFEPDDNWASELLNIELDFARYWAVDCADRFVLITIYTLSVSRPVKGIVFFATSVLRVIHLKGGTPLSLSTLYGGRPPFTRHLVIGTPGSNLKCFCKRGKAL